MVSAVLQIIHFGESAIEVQRSTHGGSGPVRPETRYSLQSISHMTWVTCDRGIPTPQKGKRLPVYWLHTCHFTILSRSQSAISSIANLNSRSIQEHALNFAHTYNQVLPHLRTHPSWSNRPWQIPASPTSAKQPPVPKQSVCSPQMKSGMYSQPPTKNRRAMPKPTSNGWRNGTPNPVPRDHHGLTKPAQVTGTGSVGMGWCWPWV